MPEGDTIHAAARKIAAALGGASAVEVETPHPRFARDRWPERLGGRTVRAVDAHGKHLFIRFDGGLTLHSHLRMTGAWHVYENGSPWRRARRRAWLVLRANDSEVVQFDGPVLELMTDSRTRFDRRLTGLGPDILAAEFDADAYVRRIRADDPGRELGDALLDQRNVAGIGNVWKAEGCFAAEVDPWRELAAVEDSELLAVAQEARARMRHSAERGGRARGILVYNRAGRPCPRCGARIRARPQGDGARTTYWCPGCQR